MPAALGTASCITSLAHSTAAAPSICNDEHRHHITTGSFASGTKQAAFERGAAPIILIDGEKLLDLLRQYQIGVSKQAIEYVEFDPTKLA